MEFRPIHFKSLDGLRGVAVLLVLLAHAGAPFPKSGGVGVDIFFVISGFLITGILSREFVLTSRLSLWRFYARRVLRLGPALIITLGLVTVLSLLRDEDVPFGSFALALSYTANWAMALSDFDMKSLGHCWSLSIEEQYYLFWPVVILMLEKNATHAQVKCLLLLCASMLAALYRCAFIDRFTVERIYYGLDTHLDGLIMGSSLYYLSVSFENGGMKLPIQRLHALVLTPLSVFGLIFVMATLGWWNPWMGKLGFFCCAIAASVIVLDITVNPLSQLHCVLASEPLVWIGRISYGLYLYHYPIFDFFDKTELQVGVDDAGLVVGISKFVATFVMAAVSYRLVEVRFLGLKKYCQVRSETSLG